MRNDHLRRRRLFVEQLENRLVLSAAFDLIGLTAFRADPAFAGLDGSGIGIAVIDAGIGQHDLLNPVVNINFVAGASVPASARGTHVAGIIAADDPEIGVAPGAELVGLQVFTPNVSGPPLAQNANIEQALQWVLDNQEQYNIRVVNMSLGSGFHSSETSGASAMPNMHLLVQRLEDLGIAVVTSAGDDCGAWIAQTSTACTGAAAPGIFSTFNVGAVWETVEPIWSIPASYSKGAVSPHIWDAWGSYDDSAGPDQLAHFSQRPPAELMNSVFAPGGAILSTVPGGGLSEMSGTGLAAPVVSGSLALLQEVAWKYGGRYLSADELQEVVAQTSDIIVDGDDEASGLFNDAANPNRWPDCALGECSTFPYTAQNYRRINVHRAAQALKAHFESFAPPPPGGTPGSGDPNSVIQGAFLGPRLSGGDATPLLGRIGIDCDTTFIGPKDVDMVQFEVLVPGTVTIEVASRPDMQLDFDSVLRLFDPAGRQLAYDDDGGQNTFSKLDIELDPGTYFAGISGFGNVAYNPLVPRSGVNGVYGNYSLRLSLWNGELNGLLANAVDVPLAGGGIGSQVVGGSIGDDFGRPVGPADVDLYRIVVPDDGIVLVDIDTPYTSGYVDSYLQVFDQYGNPVAGNDQGLAYDRYDVPDEFTDEQYPGLVFEDETDRSGVEGHTTDSFLRASVNRGEVYYLGVSNNVNIAYVLDSLAGRIASGSEGDYALSFRFFSRDLDGTMPTAVPLQLPANDIAGFVGWDFDPDVSDWIDVGDKDVDMFQVMPASDGILHINVDSHGNGSIADQVDTVVYVLDTAGAILGAMDNADGLDPDLFVNVQGNHQYAIAVVGAGNASFDPFQTGSGMPGDTGEYRLSAELLSTSAATSLRDDVMGYGGVATLVLNQWLVGWVGSDQAYAGDASDVDLYRFVAPVTTNVEIRTFPNSIYRANTFLRVFDVSGNEIARNDDVAADDLNSRIVLSVASGQTYYLGVNGAGPDADAYDPTSGAGAAPGDTGEYYIGVFHDNAPPTIDEIADVEIDEDSDEVTLPLSGISAGLGESGQVLAVYASSSNPAILPHPTVTYISPNATGAIQFQPVPDAAGTVSISVFVVDSGIDNNLDTLQDNGWSSTTFTVTVNPVPDPPEALDDDYTATENETLVITAPGVLGNDRDADGHALCAVLTETASFGVLELHCDGSFSYTPNQNFNREDTFTYAASDGIFISEPATVNFVVETEYPWHNGASPLNTSNDGFITPIDALLPINSLNRDGTRQLPLDRARPLTAPFYDTNRDGFLSPIDALLVINHLNRFGSGEGEADRGPTSAMAVSRWWTVPANAAEPKPAEARDKEPTRGVTSVDSGQSMTVLESLDLLFARLDQAHGADNRNTIPVRTEFLAGDLDEFLEGLPGLDVDE